MKSALLILAITLFSLNGVHAFESKCNFCSKDTQSYFRDSLTKQFLTSELLQNSKSIFVASEISNTESGRLAPDSKADINPITRGPYNLDNILEMINETESIEQYTEQKIDLLANFRDGDDVVVPLGFFLYMNKKF